MRGKEDPLLKVGETNDRTQQGSSNIVWSLKNMNFEIEQGDAIGIIGRNGAGKSTLLKILSRVTSPTVGSVKIKGRIASLLEVGTGFHPELTGRENIFLNGAILGMRKKEIRKKFDEIVAFSGVERYIDTPVKRYSSGMYVRLAFAVAAHLESEILIVDEVLAVGDFEFQKKCLGKMNEVSKGEGRTVLFVSHQMGVLTQLCEKAILLDKGQLKMQGLARNVVPYYIGSNESNINASEYEFQEPANKLNYFTSIYSVSSIGEKKSDFLFDENVCLCFEFTISEKINNLQIGIGLNDKFQSRIFTMLRPIDDFQEIKPGKFIGKVKLPANIIAPNMYSFAFAIWTKDGKIYDLVDNICRIKIHDSGTNLALYEGVDYGSVIINGDWNYDS